MAAGILTTHEGRFSISPKAGILALLLCIPSFPVYAATATTTFAVTVSVLATCLISANALNFPAYIGVVSDIATTISLTCTNNTTYNVGLNAGTASGASVVDRMMTSASGGHLPYTLYSDSGRTVNWGNTVGTDTVARTGNGSAQVLTVYGRLAAEQFVTPGNYTDTIIATVTY